MNINDDVIHTINFDLRFAGSIEAGIKKQTIRRGRKVCVGDVLYLVEDKGTTSCRRLRTTHCVMIHDIYISTNSAILLDNVVLSRAAAEQLAIGDGFDSLKDMMRFLKSAGGLPLDGQLVRWM